MDFTQIVSNLFHVYYNHSYFCEIINFVRICNIYNQTNQRKKFRKLYLTKQVHYDTFICKKGVEQSEFYFYTPLLYSFYCHISQHFYCVSFQYNNASHPTKMQQPVATTFGFIQLKALTKKCLHYTTQYAKTTVTRNSEEKLHSLFVQL